MASGSEGTGAIYLFALVGALVGAGLSRLIVNNLQVLTLGERILQPGGEVAG